MGKDVKGLAVDSGGRVGEEEGDEFERRKEVLEGDDREFERVFLSMSLRIKFGEGLLGKELVDLKVEGSFT